MNGDAQVWLSGGRGDTGNDVYTDGAILDNISLISTYQWILKKESPGDGQTIPYSLKSFFSLLTHA